MEISPHDVVALITAIATLGFAAACLWLARKGKFWPAFLCLIATAAFYYICFHVIDVAIKRHQFVPVAAAAGRLSFLSKPLYRNAGLVTDQLPSSYRGGV